jgi:protein-disulfide isomerase
VRKAPSWPTLGISLAAVTLVAATCKRDQKADVPPAPAPVVAPPAASSSGAAAPPGETALRTPAPDDLPGFPISELPEPAAKQLLQFAQDDFCYCGRPNTVQGCLRDHHCRHAKRMLMVAAGEAAQGAKSSELVKLLNDYYASFADDKRTAFDVQNAACTGPDSAPVTLVEFSDFECPFCAMARPMLEQLVKDEGGKLRFCFKTFPLSVHPHSGPAAEAAYYAREHGKFWEMHDLMFQNQGSLDNDSLKGWAQKAGLDGDELIKAVVTEKYAASITASKEEGKKAGVQGTPSIFLNGRPLVLPIAEELLRHAIDDEIEWKSNGGHWSAD